MRRLQGGLVFLPYRFLAISCDAEASLSVRDSSMNAKSASFADLVRNASMPMCLGEDWKISKTVLQQSLGISKTIFNEN